MMITPLQALLRESSAFHAAQQVTGAARTTVWRWKRGKFFPKRHEAEQLVRHFEPEGLTMDGCYIASVEVDGGAAE